MTISGWVTQRRVFRRLQLRRGSHEFSEGQPLAAGRMDDHAVLGSQLSARHAELRRRRADQ